MIFQRFNNDPYVHKYVVLSLSAVIVTMLSGFTLQFTGIRGARNLHSHMLNKILRVPMRLVCSFYKRGATKDGFSGQFFRIFQIIFFGFVVAIFDLVQNVKTIHREW